MKIVDCTYIIINFITPLLLQLLLLLLLLLLKELKGA
jgi:hypothetical protein